MDGAAPDGIGQAYEDRRGRANPLPLILLALLLGAGLSGLLGGQSAPVRTAVSGAADLSVRAPHILRNGMVFETVVEVRPRRPVDDLVIAISDDLWREVTINTMIPAAGEESHKGGFHRFSFGRAEAGEIFRFKIDGQINPPLTAGVGGQVAALDGDRKLVGMPVAMKVLP